HTYLPTYLWLYSPCGRFFSSLILYTAVALLGRGISPSQGRYLHTGQRVGYEPTIPVFKRAKTVHVSDRAATVIDHTRQRSGQERTGATLQSALWPNTQMRLFKSYTLTRPICFCMSHIRRSRTAQMI
ncbi:hypothetical protein B7P43_G01809, partial [Cryptotermes secundus]